MLKKEEGDKLLKYFFNNIHFIWVCIKGGRKKPILNGYIQPFLTKTCTIDSFFNMEKDKTMLLGGEHANLNLFLKKPMVLFPGDRFTSNYKSII